MAMDMKTSDFGTSSSAGSRSVSRALQILETLADLQGPVGLAPLAQQLSIPKSSCLALLRALVAHQFVRQHDAGGYSLGVRSFEVGEAYLRTVNPLHVVRADLQALSQRLEMTSHFAVLDGDAVVYLAKYDPPGRRVKLASALGGRLPATTTAVGRAQLAFSAMWPPSWTREFRGLLENVRLHGYAVDQNETVAGVRCVAAPIFDNAGCCGALGVSDLVHGGGPDLQTAASSVMAAAERVTGELGGRWRPSSPG